MTATYDLVIRGGTVVNVGGTQRADVGIRGQAIAQIGGEMRADREIDAAGMLVIPGGIDAHVHLTLPESPAGEPTWCDDFVSGTAAAAAGGITTVGNMTFPRTGETLRQAIERESAEAMRDAIVDVFLHPVLTDPQTQNYAIDLPLLAELGYTSLKYFMSFGGFLTQPEEYLRATAIARDLGMITLVHCEDAAMLDFATRDLIAQGKTDIALYAASRPIASEISATARAVAFAQQLNAPTYVVHLSSEGALNEVRKGRAAGAPVWIETRPLYLHLTEERFAEPDGGKYVGQPPLRTPSDRNALWDAVAAGEIDTVCTDHAPWLYEHKVGEGVNISTIRPGVPDLDTLMPMLFSEGVVSGRMSLERFVAVTSTNAARLFGLYPRKGTIAVGADADLVIWDPAKRKPVRAAEAATNSDYSPYEGWEVTGWPNVTISRGEVVFRDGMVIGKPGRGELPRRLPMQRL